MTHPLTQEQLREANELFCKVLNERDTAWMFRISSGSLYVKARSASGASVGTYYPLVTVSHDSLQRILDVLTEPERMEYKIALANQFIKEEPGKSHDHNLWVAFSEALFATIEQKVAALLATLTN